MNEQHLLLALNIAVVFLFTIAYVPQLITTYKTKDNTGVSSFFWMLVSISTVLTLHNVLLTGDASWYVYLGQVINATVATVIFLWLFKSYQGRTAVLMFIVYGILLLFILKFFNHDGIQTAATLTIIIAYIDQIRHFIKTKDSEGTNPFLYIIFTIGIICLVSIFILTNVSLYVVYTECVNIALLLTCAYLSIKYKKD